MLYFLKNKFPSPHPQTAIESSNPIDATSDHSHPTSAPSPRHLAETKQIYQPVGILGGKTNLRNARIFEWPAWSPNFSFIATSIVWLRSWVYKNIQIKHLPEMIPPILFEVIALHRSGMV